MILAPGDIALHAGRRTAELDVQNKSDHTIFVSSHYPFFETNRRLAFDRALAWGMHLDLPAGDSACFRPGEVKRVRLVAYGGAAVITGFNGLTDGAATPDRLADGIARVQARGYGHRPSDGGT